MGHNTVNVILNMHKRNISADIEIPLDISANELVLALNTAYELGIDTSDIKCCYLKSENPIALIKGGKTLRQLGIHDGSFINFTE